MSRPFNHTPDYNSSSKYLQSESGKAVVIDDPRAVFEGEYERVGRDLHISAPDGTVYKVIDYFAHGSPPALLSSTGAMLDGATVEALAGSEFAGQWAQAGRSASAAVSLLNIGKVQTLNGEATATRSDGTIVRLIIGEQVYQGDVIQTKNGAAVSITFKDGSIFAVSENARMVLDKMVYDPSGSSNSMLFNLIQGTFSFIAGKIASTGKMEVETPVATMGIRGTTVVATIEAQSGATKFSLVNDPDGTTGSFSIFNKQTGQLIGTVTSTQNSLFVQTINSPPVEQPRDVAAEKNAVDQIYNAFADYQRRGSLETEGNNNNEVQKASLQFNSSGIGDAPDPSDPLQSFQTARVNEVAPLGDEGGTEALPEGITETTVQPSTEPDVAPPTVVVEAAPLPPVLTVPSLSLSVTEDGSAQVTGFTLSTNHNAPITVTITAQSTVTLASLSGLSFSSGDGVADESMQFVGNAQSVINALNGLTYFPTPNNDVVGGLTITLDDGLFVVSTTLSVSIVAIPDAPVANDDQFVAIEGTPLVGNVIADNGNGEDFDIDTGDSFTVTAVNGAHRERLERRRLWRPAALSR